MADTGEIPIDGSTATDAGSALCLSCGLCCAGAIYDHAYLNSDEVDHALRLGLQLSPRERLSFALPCPLLDGTRCTVYGRRPRVCGGYKCKVLLHLEGGRLPLGEALAIVATARSLHEDFRADCAAPAQSPVEIHRQTLRRSAQRLYLDKHFRKDDEEKMVKWMTVAPYDRGDAG